MAKLTLPALERFLGGAADILRGSVDPSEYRHCILGLVFFKRICDMLDEGVEEAVPGLAQGSPELRIHVPSGCRWSDVRGVSNRIGAALDAAFQAIEEANPSLRGVLKTAKFGDVDRYSDHLLDTLMHHLDGQQLGNADVDARILGDAYEHLLGQFAAEAGKQGREIYTPRQVARLMVEILRPWAGMTVYDPTCGSGGLLLAAVHYLERHGTDASSVKLYGQDKNPTAQAICMMSLILHGIDATRVVQGDTLLEPRHLGSDGGLERFDLVLANPPFSLKPWGHESWSQGDPFGRDTYGCPPKSNGDFAFIEHMIASLKSTGRMAVVCPHGVLFRGGYEGKIRRGIIEDDLVEAVVGLGPNLFPGTPIPAAVLVINKAKAAERRGKVLFVNGEKDFVAATRQNSLSDFNVETLANAVHSFEDVNLLCRVVTLDEIRAHGHSLNIGLYVQNEPPPSPIDVNEEIRRLDELTAARDEAEARMNRMLRKLDLED